MNEPLHDPATPAAAERAHQRTWALIPWLVNGTAPAADRALAEAHLATCADCRAELDAQREWHQALRAEPAQPPGIAPRSTMAPSAATGSTPDPAVEVGLQRLLGRLDAPAVDQPSATETPPTRRGGRLSAALAAAVVIQAVGLGLLSLQLLRQDQDAGFRTLSQPAAATAPAAATLRVVPDGAMPIAQWQALLQSQALQIVGGPNTVGAYALAPLDPATAPPTPELLSRLRATPGIQLAEPLDPAP